MVGLSLAHQLLERKISNKIIIIDKEKKLGLHSSGRNSGVLHAGIYYEPNSLKAKVSVDGSKRLKEWICERNLTINNCGKVIIPQKEKLDSQLDKLLARGKANGATVELIDNKDLHRIIECAYSPTGRALWSPNTSVVKPIEVIEALESDLKERGVEILKLIDDFKVITNRKEILLKKENKVEYDHLINCSGLQSDKVAHSFGIGRNYKIMPFKGLYWRIKKNAPLKIKTNLYPVPDLNVPFLGIHFTPTADKDNVTIGPTAVPAFGRENYTITKGIEPLMALKNLSLLGQQYLLNRGGFRKYVNEQAFLSFTPFLLKAAQGLIPSIKLEHIELSEKVGIRAQLFNIKENQLEDDFICIKGPSSTHILNAISPAFTASFSLGDLIIDRIIK